LGALNFAVLALALAGAIRDITLAALIVPGILLTPLNLYRARPKISPGAIGRSLVANDDHLEFAEMAALLGIAGLALVTLAVCLTPQTGFPHNNRVGDFDAFALLKLLPQGYSVEDVLKKLGKEGGLLGVSGVSNDMRDIEKAAADGNARANIFNEVTQSSTHAGIILLVWVNGIMYVMRQFFGRIPHSMSPTLLIAVTAPLSALGLYLFGQTTTPAMWYVAAALLAIGTAFWWPTMLGITSERFPAGGALPSSCARVRRSETSVDMRSACCAIRPSTRVRSTSLNGRSRNVSTNPASTVNGVRISCETLATKSRRMASIRSCSLRSCDRTSFDPAPNCRTTTWIDPRP
jgi:hypothetical protein